MNPVLGKRLLLTSFHRQAWPFLMLGFGAGLPYLLVFSTLSAWLTDYGIARTTIGFLSWVGMTYSLKFLWAPWIDQVRLPWLDRLGRRRSWLLLAQIGVVIGILLMSFCDPSDQLGLLILGAFIVAFTSATQDIALDAFRIEQVESHFQGIAVANYIFGYRAALLFAGAGALFIADISHWGWSYAVMALSMLPAMLLTLWLTEQPLPSALSTHQSASLKAVVRSAIDAFRDFFATHGRLTIALLALVALYRLTDVSLGVMALPFYLETGFSKSEVAAVSKVFGFAMTLLGSALGGWMVVRYGQLRPLIWGAWLSLLSNFLFIALSWSGPKTEVLAMVISADNLGGGIANVALIAFMSSLTQAQHTATQYALLSSLMTLLGKIISGFSGWIVDISNYTWFFVYTAALGVPALCLCYGLAAQMRKKESTEVAVASTSEGSSA